MVRARAETGADVDRPAAVFLVDLVADVLARAPAVLPDRVPLPRVGAVRLPAFVDPDALATPRFLVTDLLAAAFFVGLALFFFVRAATAFARAFTVILLGLPEPGAAVGFWSGSDRGGAVTVRPALTASAMAMVASSPNGARRPRTLCLLRWRAPPRLRLRATARCANPVST